MSSDCHLKYESGKLNFDHRINWKIQEFGLREHVPLDAWISIGVDCAFTGVKKVPTFFPFTTFKMTFSLKPFVMTTDVSCSKAHVAALTFK